MCVCVCVCWGGVSVGGWVGGRLSGVLWEVDSTQSCAGTNNSLIMNSDIMPLVYYYLEYLVVGTEYH